MSGTVAAQIDTVSDFVPFTFLRTPTTRHGAYDFYTEQLAAPDDLKHLTDLHESMAFRRRGEQRASSTTSVLRQAIDC